MTEEVAGDNDRFDGWVGALQERGNKTFSTGRTYGWKRNQRQRRGVLCRKRSHHMHTEMTLIVEWDEIRVPIRVTMNWAKIATIY